MEDALYDSAPMRGFVDIDLGREPAPDDTNICKFCHLIEANGLGEMLFEAVNAHLSAKGILRCIRPRKAINGILA